MCIFVFGEPAKKANLFEFHGIRGVACGEGGDVKYGHIFRFLARVKAL